jgi:GcrA cell cycle regulator
MRNEWSPLQREMLLELYPHLPNIEIAEIINAATGSTFHDSSVRCKHSSLNRSGFVEKIPYIPNRPSWTDELDALLRKLVADGKLSIRAIAAEINMQMGTAFTKNAVCGAMNRRGLLRVRPHGTTAPRAARAAKKRERASKYSPSLNPITGLFEAVAIPVTAKNIPFLDRGTSCAWPTSGEGMNMLVCGNDTADGRSYCQFHNSVAYQPYERKRKAYTTFSGHTRYSFGANA